MSSLASIDQFGCSKTIITYFRKFFQFLKYHFSDLFSLRARDRIVCREIGLHTANSGFTSSITYGPLSSDIVQNQGKILSITRCRQNSKKSKQRKLNTSFLNPQCNLLKLASYYYVLFINGILKVQKVVLLMSMTRFYHYFFIFHSSHFLWR